MQLRERFRNWLWELLWFPAEDWIKPLKKCIREQVAEDLKRDCQRQEEIAALRADITRLETINAGQWRDVDLAKQQSHIVHTNMCVLKKQLTALQALDVSFHETGKIILLARVGGRDIVKIIDTAPTWTLTEYKQRVEQLESLYGARVQYMDSPLGMPSVVEY